MMNAKDELKPLDLLFYKLEPFELYIDLGRDGRKATVYDSDELKVVIAEFHGPPDTECAYRRAVMFVNTLKAVDQAARP